MPRELAQKESDRIEAVTGALRALGIRIKSSDDGFRVRGVPSRPKGGAMESDGDHRIAMVGAVAGLLSREGVRIEGAEAVSVSFPGFYDLLESVTQPMIVAIDGPAGAGKSTVARSLAERLGFRYLDTGAMYRALTWLAKNENVPLDKGARLGELAEQNPVDFDEHGRCFIARHRRHRRDPPGRDRPARPGRGAASGGARGDEGAPARARTGGRFVIEGRDIGTVVAPGAAVKIYLQADPQVRAGRRLAERPEIGADALATDLRARDEKDAERMQPAEDAELIDTTKLTVEDVVDHIEQLVRARAAA